MSLVHKPRIPSPPDSKADIIALQNIQHLDRHGDADETVMVWLGAKEDEGELLA